MFRPKWKLITNRHQMLTYIHIAARWPSCKHSTPCAFPYIHTEPLKRIRLNFLISTTHTGTGAHNDNPRHIVLENFHPWAHGAWEGHCRGEEKFSNMCLSTPKLIFLQTMCSFYHSLPTSFISKSSWSIMHMFANSHTCRLEQQKNYTKKTIFHYEKSSICSYRSLHMYYRKNNSKKLHFLMALAQQ